MRYEQFRQVCESRRCKLEMKLPDWVSDEVDSKTCVLIRCNICNVQVDTTCIGHFVNSGSLGCGCRFKSEQMVRDYLSRKFNVVSARFDWCRNKKGSGYILPFDMQLENKHIIIEVDGEQHFTPDHYFYRTSSYQLACTHDRLKEDLAMKKGYGVIRILQTEVWNDENNWGQRLMDAIDYVAVNKPCVKVLYKVVV